MFVFTLSHTLLLSVTSYFEGKHANIQRCRRGGRGRGYVTCPPLVPPLHCVCVCVWVCMCPLVQSAVTHAVYSEWLCECVSCNSSGTSVLVLRDVCRQRASTSRQRASGVFLTGISGNQIPLTDRTQPEFQSAAFFWTSLKTYLL